jgi:long-chain acyl-CoA synthetase
MTAEPRADAVEPGGVPTMLPAVLADAVARFGAPRVAVRGPSRGELRELSYGELDRRSAALRDTLARSIAPGDFVPLCGRNSLEWIVALFGALRAGAIPVPLNPDAHADDLQPILAELAPRALLADASLLRRLPAGAELRIALDELDAEATPESTGADATRAPDDPALMLYTTGTTGRPKGVLLSHRNLTANVEGVIDATTLGSDDVVLVALPLYHSFPLTTGCLAAVAAGVRIELEARPTRLAARLGEAQPTLIIGVPALYELLIARIRHRAAGGVQGLYFRAAMWLNGQLIQHLGLNAGRLLFRSLHRALGGRLRYAICGGAPLAAEVQRDAFRLGLPLLQGFGMTEASPVISVQRFDPAGFWRGRRYWERAGSCGAPLRGLTVEIEPLPGADAGVGEIVVSGASVMLGYHRRESETAEALQGGHLHTGDLGRIDQDGELWIRGRRGLAVSTPRGKIVHLERLEQAIARAPEVGQVAVVAEPRPQWRLTAIVFPAADAALDGAATAAAIEARVGSACFGACRDLEPHERIDGVALTDEPLPETPLGKIRRGELPAAPSFDARRWREAVEKLPDAPPRPAGD